MHKRLRLDVAFEPAATVDLQTMDHGARPRTAMVVDSDGTANEAANVNDDDDAAINVDDDATINVDDEAANGDDEAANGEAANRGDDEAANCEAANRGDDEAANRDDDEAANCEAANRGDDEAANGEAANCEAANRGDDEAANGDDEAANRDDDGAANRGDDRDAANRGDDREAANVDDEAAAAASPPVYSCVAAINVDRVADAFRLFVPRDGAVGCDVTYGRGKFWDDRVLGRHTVLATDLATVDGISVVGQPLPCLAVYAEPPRGGVDLRAVPYRNGCLDFFVMDPPYSGGYFRRRASQTSRESDFNTRYGHHAGGGVDGLFGIAAVKRLYDLGIAEAKRTLKPKTGVLLVKCMDSVENHRKHFLTDHVTAAAAAAGFAKVDMLLVVRLDQPHVRCGARTAARCTRARTTRCFRRRNKTPFD
jgi:hypothetical protein